MDRCSVFEDYLDWEDDRRFDESKKLKIALENEQTSTVRAMILLEDRKDWLAHQVQLLVDGSMREVLHELSLEMWQVNVDERGLRKELNTASRNIALVKALLARAKQTTLADGVADMAYYKGLFVKVFCKVLLEVTGDCLIIRSVFDNLELRRLQLACIKSVCCEELPPSGAPTGLYSEYALKVLYATGSAGKLRTTLFRIKEIRETLNSVAVGSDGLAVAESCNFTGFCSALVSSLSVYCQASINNSDKCNDNGDPNSSSCTSEANINGDEIHFEGGLFEGETLFESRTIERRWSFDGELQHAVRSRGISEGSTTLCSSSNSSSTSGASGSGSGASGNARRGSGGSAGLTTPLKAAVAEATTTPLSSDTPSYLVAGSSSRYSIAFNSFASPSSIEHKPAAESRVSDSQSLSLSAVTTLESHSHNYASGHSDGSGHTATGTGKSKSRVLSLLELLARLRGHRDEVNASLVERIALRERLRMDVSAVRTATQRCRCMLVSASGRDYEELLGELTIRICASQRTEEKVLIPLRANVEGVLAVDRQLARLRVALEEISAARAQNGARLRRLQRLELLTHSGKAPSGADIDKADLYDVDI